MKKSKLNKKHISYVPTAGGAWWVRFLSSKLYGKQSNKLHKLFHFRNYKDEDSAFRAAVRWRNKMLRERPELINKLTGGSHLKGKYHQKKTHGDTRLIVGVNENIRTNRNPAYVATWQETNNGKRAPKTKSFTYKIDNLQDKKLAYEKAVAYRKKMVKQHYTGAV